MLIASCLQWIYILDSLVISSTVSRGKQSCHFQRKHIGSKHNFSSPSTKKEQQDRPSGREDTGFVPEDRMTRTTVEDSQLWQLTRSIQEQEAAASVLQGLLWRGDVPLGSEIRIQGTFVASCHDISLQWLSSCLLIIRFCLGIKELHCNYCESLCFPFSLAPGLSRLVLQDHPTASCVELWGAGCYRAT